MHPGTLRLTGLAAVGVASALVAAACGSSSASPAGARSSSGGAATVAFLMPCSTCASRFENQDKPDFIAAVHALNADMKVIANNAEGSASTQLSQAENAITNGAKVLVVSPLDQTTGVAIASKAQAAHVSVVSYDGEMTGTSYVHFYVSFDPTTVGKLQGQYLVDNLPKGSTVAMINGDQTAETGRDFKQGALDALQPAFTSGQLKLGYSADTPQFNPAKAQAEMDAALTAMHDDVQGVLSPNDGIAGGVIASLTAQHLAGKVLITGQDATDAGLGNILVGTQAMTVYKSIKQEAAAAAKVAVGLATGDSGVVSQVAKTKVNNGTADIPALLLTPQVITKANVADVVNDGGATWSGICSGIPAADCPKS